MEILTAGALTAFGRSSKKIRNMFTTILLMALMTATSCQKNDPAPEPEPQPKFHFSTIAELTHTLDSLAFLQDGTQSEAGLNRLWDTLKAQKRIPFCVNDSVLFLYKGSSRPAWAGDFNGWNPESPGWKGEQIGQSNFWMLRKQFPADARLDYKIVMGNNWINDPANPNIQYSGFGSNSFFAMPEWVFPEETCLWEGVVRGGLSEKKVIHSQTQNLGYDVAYKVYLPHNYQDVNNLAVVYVTDGQEYSDDRLGAMVIVLDNLIFTNKIEPIIVVFIDPRDPSSPAINRRMSEYTANPRFANFVADELVPVIDSDYKTESLAERRAILGTSLGGWNSAFFGIHRSDRFRLIGIHSPAFDNAILSQYEQSETLPLKIFMSTGTIFDTQERARAMRDILTTKGYPLRYVEVNQGHSWGNWRELMDEPLLFFFKK